MAQTRSSTDSVPISTVASLKNDSESRLVEGEIVRWRKSGGPRRQRDCVVCEEPLEIRVRGRSIAVTMRTPGDDAELAAGFLWSEGIIHSPDDLTAIQHCRQANSGESGNTLNVFLAPSVEVSFERLTRHVFASSSCGVCGKATIEAVHQHFPPVDSSLKISAERLMLLPDRLRAAQETFERTGGLHAAAVFDSKAELIALREDAGRHNAVDKVIGYGLLQRQLPFTDRILMVSGRASFEIVQKALSARIPVVAAISAPSNLAVEFAHESGQTLIGFLRGETMNIYSHPERIS